MPDETSTDWKTRFAVNLRGLIGIWLIGGSVLTAYSLFLHYVYRSTSLDLALHSQLLWNLARGRFMETSFLSHSFAANHFWPGLYILVPFHALTGTLGLLVIQAFGAAAGVFAVYYLTHDITERRDWATVLAVSYLVHPTLSIGVLFDFHPELLAMPCALAALLFLNRRAYLTAAAFLAITWGLYEVTAVVFFLFGLLLLFRKADRKCGLVMTVASLVYIAIVFFIIMPRFRHSVGIPHMERWTDPVVARGEIRQVWYLFVAVGLLPLLGIRYVLPALPLLALLVYSRLELQSDIRFGYVTPAIPFLYLAAAHGAGRLIRFKSPRLRHLQSAAPVIVLLAAIGLSCYFHDKYPIRPKPFTVRPNIEAIRLASDIVPPDASLSADNHLGAHFAERPVLLLTPNSLYMGEQVDYVLADLQEDQYRVPGWLDGMRALLSSGSYSPVFFTDGVVVLEKSEELSLLTPQVLAYLNERAEIAGEE